jgi:fused signal recognition particle receptor
VIIGKTTVDDEVLDQLEEALIGADVGVDSTLTIIEKIQERVRKDKYISTQELQQILHEEMAGLLIDAPADLQGFNPPANKKPYIILVVGVNGVGKTTTIGKLAHHYKEAGNQVVLGAADTFRAAAVDQLTIWSERVGVPIVKQNMGADPSAVAFDTVQSAVSKNADVVLIDTAGRLHNKAHLMDELNKIKRVIQKQVPDAPHEVLLVLDGSTGQNALEQAKQFMAVTDVNALAITKLDGTAKGGVVLAIAHQCKIPVKYIGVGEQIKDLLLFDKDAFVDSLFNLNKN